jgi:transcriptional repressor NF-X1
MEEPDPTPTPTPTLHTNESSSHHHREEHKPSGNARHPNLPGSNSKPSKGKSKSTNAPKLGTIGGLTTPSTPRSASPDSKANDSSASQPQRKSKPKPKPSGTLGTKESEHNPTDTKPPPTKSNSRRRQGREKLDGGTADASNSGPRRQEKEVEPPHEEPRVDSGPTHGSAHAEASQLERSTPRRRRQGNFDRKLTTADDKPRREERHANPARGKYWVDYAVDDLTSRLTHDLRTFPYLDCIICYNPIRPLQPTWSCSPSSPIVPAEPVQGAQYCWVTLHLKCVRSWASKNIADTLQAYKARGENKPGDWLCIGCRARRSIEPSSYRYVRRLSASIHY